METTLKYGHFITFYGSNQKTSKKESILGSISALGFTDTNIYIRTMPANPLENSSSVTNLIDYSNMIFQIWPKLNCEASKEFNKLRKNHKYFKNMVMDEDTNKNDKEFLDLLLERIKKMEKRTLDEHESNQKLLKSHFNQNVTYGSEIQFYHLNSKMFLNGKILCSESDKSAFKFELSDQYSTGMIFKVLPRYKLRQEGEKVQYNDQILLFNIKVQCFANFSTEFPIEIDRPLQIPNDKQSVYPNFVMRNMLNSGLRYEAYLSNTPDCYWQLLYNGNDEIDSPGKIHGGDIIRLIHTEFDGELCADTNYNNEFHEVFIRKYFGEFSEEKYSVNSLWEVEIYRSSFRGDQINLRSSENKEQIQYRLRHFLTGRVLTVSDGLFGSDAKEKAKVLSIVAEDKNKEKFDKKAFVQFEPTTIENQGYLEDEVFYNLVIDDLYAYVDPKVDYKPEEKDGLGSTKNNLKNLKSLNPNANAPKNKVSKSMTSFSFATTQEKFYIPLKNKEYFINRFGIHCKSENSSENAFKIEKINPEMLKEIYFVNSCYDVLIRFVNVMKSGNKEMLTSNLLRNVSNTLIALIFFVIKTENPNPIECEGIPVQSRQKIMKDMKIIEILTDILYWPFRNSIYDIKNLKEVDPEIIKIFQLTYRLIKHTIKDFKSNELYTSQWLDLFMKQTMLSNKDSDILADSTLTELIDNNPRILESKIKPEIIEDFIDLLINQELNEKYVKLLRAITTCDGKAVVGNQKTLSELIFESQNIKEKLFFPIKIDENMNIFIKIINDKEYIELKEFCSEEGNELDENKILYNYFLEFVHLLADLCLDRNYIAIEALKDTFSFETCFQIISSSIYDVKLRYSFTRLMLHLWVDRSPFIKLILPNRIRVWGELGNGKNIIPCFNGDLTKYEKVKTYVIQFLGNIQQQKAYQTNDNLLTQAVLQLCKNMVEFGFYSSATEFEELLTPILSLLNGINDIASKESEEAKADQSPTLSPRKKGRKKTYHLSFENNNRDLRYEQTEDNLIVHGCKEICCEILKIIMLIKDDIKITHFMSDFKKLIDDQSDNKITLKTVSKKKLKSLSRSSNPKDLDEEDYSSNTNSIVDNLCDNDEINLSKQSNYDPSAILLDLALYKSDGLINKSYDLLINIYSNRTNLIKMLKKLQILEDSNTISVYLHAKNLQNDLSELAEKTENWLGVEESPEAHKNSEKCLELLDNLSDLLKISKLETILKKDDMTEVEKHISNNELLSLTDDDLFNEKVLFKKNEVPNIINQNILRNLKIYEDIIEILNFDIETFSIFRENKVKINDLHLKILKKCYFVLARFVTDNQENQLILADYLKEIFLKHIKTLPEVNAGLLIQKLLKENKQLLSRTNDLILTLSTMTQTIDILPAKGGIKTNYLDSFKVMTKIGERIYKSNQTQIITSLCNREYKNVLLLCLDETGKQEMSKLVKSFISELDESGTKIVDLPDEINYFCTLLKVMSVTCEEENNATESKCQSYFGLKHLINLMKIAEECLPLKKNIMNFFFNVYLETERELSEEQFELDQLIKIIYNEISNINNNLKGLSRIRLQKSVSSTKTIKEKYLVFVLFPCFSQIIKKKFIKEDTIKNEFNLLITDCLPKICHSIDINEIKLREKLSNFIEEMIEAKVLDISIKNKIDKEIFNSPTKFFIKKQVNHLNSNETLKEMKLISQIQILESDIRFIKKSEEEFENLVDYILKISDRTEEIFKGICTLKFEEIAKSLIDLLRNSESSLTSELRVFMLRIFRKIIEMENPSQTKPSSDWSNNDYNIKKKQITKRQNQLVNLGVVEMLVQIISSNDMAKEIKHEAILAGIAILLGGNPNSQESFFNVLKSDDQNKFLLSIKKIIQKSFEYIKKNMSHMNKKIMVCIIESNKLKEKTIEEISKSPEKQKSNKNITLNTEEENPTLALNLFEEDINELVFLRRLLRFLQLFCEGHNLNLQNCIREQRFIKSGRTFNFVLMTAQFFQTYIKFVNIFCMDIGNQLLDLMIESIQGPCKDNQMVFCKNKVIDTCKDFLAKYQRKIDFHKGGFYSDDEKDQVSNIVTKSSKLLYSLIEGEANQEIINILYEGLDLNFIINRLKEEFVTYLERIGVGQISNPLVNLLRLPELDFINDKLPDHFDDDLMEAFSLYLLIITLSDPLINQKSSEQIKQILENVTDPTTLKCLEFFKFHTKSIEINFKKNIIRVYFPVHPICHLISKNTRVNFALNVNRETQNDKLKDLLKETPSFFDEIFHFAFLKKQIINISSKRLNLIRDISTVLAFFINFWIIYAYSITPTYKDDSFNKGYIDTSQGSLPIDEIINVLGYIQLATSTTMLIMWIIIFSPIILKRKWREISREYKQSMTDEEKIWFEEKFNENDDIYINQKSTNDMNQYLLVKGPEDQIFFQEKLKIDNEGNEIKVVSRSFGNLFTKLLYYWICVKILFGNGTFMYMTFYICISFFGVFISEISYCLHLFDVINRFQTLKNVIKSVTYNYKQLLLTLMFGLILLFIYSIIAFYFFNDVYNFENENRCTTLWQCYITTINHGLRNGGGIGEVLMIMSYHSGNTSYYAIRFFFDLLYFASINIVFLNIIFGIIVDTFAELREKKNKMDEDQKNICFICGVDRYEFDRFADGFENHIERDHQLWFYVNYMYILKKKDSTDYNGLESYVSNLILKEDISWIPSLNAMSLKKEKDVDIEEIIDGSIKALDIQLEILKSKIDSVDETKIIKKNNK